MQLGLLFASAVIHAISWLDERYWVCAWIGLALLFCCLRGKSTLSASARAFGFGCVMLSVSFYWATDTLTYTLACESDDWLPYFAFAMLVLWEAVPFACLGYVYMQGDRGNIPLWWTPLFWVLVECFWPRVFPWCFAHSQTGFLSFVQAAELGGAALVSAIFVAGCVGVSQLVASEKNSFQAEVMVTAVVLCALFGFVRKSTIENELAAKNRSPLKVGVVQIDPSYMESTAKMRREIDAWQGAVDLVVLPESTLGTYSTKVTRLDQMTQDIEFARAPYIKVEPLGGIKSDVLVGGKTFEPDSDEEGPYFQTAFILGPHGNVLARYYKRYLLPIGEFAPFERMFPVFHDWVQLDQYLEAGKSATPVTLTSGAKVGVLVCYEDTVPAAARTSVAEGAELLVCIINGSAFESSTALDQHRRLAQLRSVENRRAFLRCAATGASCYISPTGEIERALPHFTEGSFQVAVQPSSRLTLFTTFGYLFPYACGVCLMVFLALSVFKQRKGNAVGQRTPKLIVLHNLGTRFPLGFGRGGRILGRGAMRLLGLKVGTCAGGEESGGKDHFVTVEVAIAAGEQQVSAIASPRVYELGAGR